jgi:hypothetical protein
MTAPYDPAKAQPLFDKALQGLPPGRSLLVIAMHTCPHCRDSLAATNYNQVAGKNTPVRWLDIADPKGMGMLKSLPGYGTSGKQITIDGDVLSAVPAIVVVENGRMTGIAKLGGIASSKELDMVAAAAQAKGISRDAGPAAQCTATDAPLSMSTKPQGCSMPQR